VIYIVAVKLIGKSAYISLFILFLFHKNNNLKYVPIEKQCGIRNILW